VGIKNSVLLKKHQLVEVNIPEDLEVVNSAKPRRAAGDIEVRTVKVHNTGEGYLAAFTMLERADGQSPINSVRDLRRVLARGLVADCDDLITGIKLRRRHEHAQYPHKYVLCLRRSGCCWSVEFRWADEGFCGYLTQVLCYSK